MDGWMDGNIKYGILGFVNSSFSSVLQTTQE